MDVGNLIRGNHSNYLLGREAINELKVENQTLNYENNKLRTELEMKKTQINSLKRKLWEKENELTQITSEREWFHKKTQSLQIALHSTTKSAQVGLADKKVNPFLEKDQKLG